jgi:catalase
MEKHLPATWTEIFEGGSVEAENRLFLTLAQDILRVQELNRERAAASQAFRTFHAKMVIGITNAQLVVDSGLPERFNVDYFTAGARLPATLRLSNASGVAQSDSTADMRGMALRLSTPSGSFHDLLMTNFPVSHARNARQFVNFARIASGDRATMAQRMTAQFGEEETARILSNLKQAARPCASLLQERFWSRGAILWGEAGPVRFNIRPSSADKSTVEAPASTPDSLTKDFVEHLRKADVSYRLALQEFASETITPIEDGAVEWKEEDAPSIDIATLVIPKQDIDSDGQRALAAVDGVAFNPWNAPSAFRPLGNLMRARKIVYAASAEKWLRT